jgi:uncharacterized protein
MEKLSANTNALNWFEISILDLDRARKFYETIFEVQLFEMTMGDMTMLMFPSQSPHSGGGLAKSPMHKPSHEGAIIYLNANPDLQLVLDRVEKAGGTIKMPKTKINDEIGAMAFITDTEGNTVGLHSGK